MLAWLTKRSSSGNTFCQRQACLEAQALKGQMALRDNDLAVASQLLQGVHKEASWWFEQDEPSPRLIAMFTGSASLYASALWRRGHYVKSFEVIEGCRYKLASACNSASVALCRKRFYHHCIDALNQTLEECSCSGKQAS